MPANFERRLIVSGSHVSLHKYRGLKNLTHWHMEQELIFAACGECEVMTGKSLYTLSEGNFIFIGGEEIHYINSPPETELWILKADTLFTERINGKVKLKDPFFQYNPMLKQQLERISNELSEEHYGHLIADSLALIIIAELFRSSETEPVASERSGDSYKALIKDIDRNFREYDFDRAAEFMCLSRPYFSKYFHKMSGMTFTEYLNIVRISAAVEMLSKGGMSMTEISDRCGFGTIRSFNRVFKELTGYSPLNLPKNYFFVKKEGNDGFDPTLSCTTVIM